MGGLAASPRRTNDTKPTRERKNEHETEPRNARKARGPRNRAAGWLTTECTESRVAAHRRAPKPFASPAGPTRKAAKTGEAGHETAAPFREFQCRPSGRFSVFSGKDNAPRPTCASDEFHLQPAQVPTGKRRGPRQRRLGGAGSSRQRPCTCKRSRAFQEWNPNGRPSNVSCAAQFSHKAKRAASSRDANEIRRT